MTLTKEGQWHKKKKLLDIQSKLSHIAKFFFFTVKTLIKLL